MKQILLIAALVFSAPIAFAQETIADQVAEAEAPKLDGLFQYEIEGTEYKIVFNRADHSYQEVNDQNQVLSTGQFKAFDGGHYALIPNDPSSAQVVNQQMLLTVISHTNNSLTVRVELNDGQQADIVLNK